MVKSGFEFKCAPCQMGGGIDIMRTGSRNWPGILGQGPQETTVLVFVLGQKPETLGSIRDPVLARDEVSGSGLLLTFFCFAFTEH